MRAYDVATAPKFAELRACQEAGFANAPAGHENQTAPTASFESIGSVGQVSRTAVVKGPEHADASPARPRVAFDVVDHDDA
ncbi:MAG TPA: hypothetical protein VF981_15250 [Gemmatimonadaceae bacterium]